MHVLGKLFIHMLPQISPLNLAVLILLLTLERSGGMQLCLWYFD